MGLKKIVKPLSPFSFAYLSFTLSSTLCLRPLTSESLHIVVSRWGTFLEVMMITDLESPVSRSKKRKIMKEQEHEHIMLQEALAPHQTDPHAQL